MLLIYLSHWTSFMDVPFAKKSFLFMLAYITPDLCIACKTFLSPCQKLFCVIIHENFLQKLLKGNTITSSTKSQILKTKNFSCLSSPLFFSYVLAKHGWIFFTWQFMTPENDFTSYGCRNLRLYGTGICFSL